MRAVAFRRPLKELKKGKFVQSSGEFDPNHIELNGENISRVNVIGVLVSVNPLVLDDGTDNILVRDYSDVMKKVKENDIVKIIGKIREQGGERFIAVESVRKVGRKEMELRKLETNTAAETLDVEEVKL